MHLVPFHLSSLHNTLAHRPIPYVSMTCLLPYSCWSNSERNPAAPWGWRYVAETRGSHCVNKEAYSSVHLLVNICILCYHVHFTQDLPILITFVEGSQITKLLILHVPLPLLYTPLHPKHSPQYFIDKRCSLLQQCKAKLHSHTRWKLLKFSVKVTLHRYYTDYVGLDMYREWKKI
jgi:hypothetical protein